MIGRLRRGVKRYGIVGSLRRTGSIAKESVRLRQEHVWYQLLLRQERRRLELEPALRLVEAGEEDLRLLDSLWPLDRAEGRRRFADRASLWLVLDGAKPAFSCWTFRGRVPIRAAAGGTLDLPDDTVCLEESFTVAPYRGRGIAPAAWSAIADRLAAEPTVRRMVTTIEAENVPSRRAVEKIGFVLIGAAVTDKLGPRIRVSVTGGGTADGGFLSALAR